MRLAEWIAHEASRYRAMDTEAGELVADHLDELAKDVRALHASSPAEYLDRNETYLGRPAVYRNGLYPRTRSQN